MPTVTVIPAKSKDFNEKGNSIHKQRVAAYCRVSTDEAEQANSYEAQISHYTEYIKSNPLWELAGIYADDGISGTTTKERKEFNRMIADCNHNKIDLIITKSISRFARNTLDCLKYIRELKELNIPIVFEKENINTLDSKGEVLITIMASLAQQESQSISQNIKMGNQFRYQQGKIQINHNWFLGYTKDEKGDLIIVSDEAEVIKRIFREYLNGLGYAEIAKGLQKDKVKTGSGKHKWYGENVKAILKNEKYIGDALLQKTYTVDFLNKKRVKNDGIVPQYYVENHHEAIIPKEIFYQVQREMDRRRNLKGPKSNSKCYCSKYALSNITICADCKENYRRVTWYRNKGKEIVWRCVSRLDPMGSLCHSPTIKEEVLHGCIVKAINGIYENKNETLKILKENIKKVLLEKGNNTENIDKEIDKIKDKLINFEADGPGYDNLINKVVKLKEEKESLLIKEADKEDRIIKINQMIDKLEHEEFIRSYDEQLVRRIVEKVIIDNNKVIVQFKSEVEIEVEY